MSLSKTLYPLLSTGLTQETSGHYLYVKHQNTANNQSTESTNGEQALLKVYAISRL